MSASAKSTRLLQIFFGAFFLIALRAWHLQIVEKETKIQEAERPKRRTLIEKGDRGIIYDRFGIPLAINRICYNACIYYDQITQISATNWREENGKRVRYSPRKEYVQGLSQTLAPLLSMDAQRIEDLILSKASLFPHSPFLLKSRLTESEHYQLAALERDWLGIHAEISSERYYPRGKSASSILGHLGSISGREYLAIAEEMRELEAKIEEWELNPAAESLLLDGRERLRELREFAYSIQDLIGKSGIEAHYESFLRGTCGKKIFEIDRKGRALQELPGSKRSSPGSSLRLSISIDLQEFAEALLTQDEMLREGRSLGIDPETKQRKALKQPWIKGGAIVALDPNTGEVLALASAPRFDPNDFISTSNRAEQDKKQKKLLRWLETEKAIGAIWDGKEPLFREKFHPEKGFYEEEMVLSWDRYLDFVLPSSGPLKALFQKLDDVKSAIQLQEDFEALLYYSKIRDPLHLLEKLYPRQEIVLDAESLSCFRRLDAKLGPLATNGDRLFAIDLCRLIVHAPAFTDETLAFLGSMKLSQYRAMNQACMRLDASLKQTARTAFHQNEFAFWRKENEKTFLAEKKQEEKEKRLPTRPYIDLLDRKERALFETHWTEKRLELLANAILSKDCPSDLETLKAYSKELLSVLHTFRSFEELQRPLLAPYKKLKNRGKEQTEKELAMAFYPLGGFGYHRSYAYQTASPQGSLFKLVTAYAALEQSKGINPLTLIDHSHSNLIASSQSGIHFSRMYRGGRLPRSHAPDIGKIDLIGALEQTSNPYFAILAGDYLQNPEKLNQTARLFSYGSKTGVDLPGEASGNLPKDLSHNRTGLYASAIGQHTILSTPLQTALMLATLANGGLLYQPILCNQVGSEKNPPPIIHSFDLLPAAQKMLFEAMDRVVSSPKGTARPTIIRKLLLNPVWADHYRSLKHQMLGKTGTAEIAYNASISPSSKAQIYKHVWFGAIGRDLHEKPEIVVVVLLRYGDGGKEAAPLAAQVIKKWRELREQQASLIRNKDRRKEALQEMQ